METGVMMEPFTVDLNSWYVFLSIIFLGLVSGIPPAISAYRVDISENLQHTV
jgi:ABC-type antimicrobial peptide transport system permease subunit